MASTIKSNQTNYNVIERLEVDELVVSRKMVLDCDIDYDQTILVNSIRISGDAILEGSLSMSGGTVSNESALQGSISVNKNAYIRTSLSVNNNTYSRIGGFRFITRADADTYDMEPGVINFVVKDDFLTIQYKTPVNGTVRFMNLMYLGE